MSYKENLQFKPTNHLLPTCLREIQTNVPTQIPLDVSVSKRHLKNSAGCDYTSGDDNFLLRSTRHGKLSYTRFRRIKGKFLPYIYKL